MRWAMIKTVVSFRLVWKDSPNQGLSGGVHGGGGVIQNQDGGFLQHGRAMHSRCFCPPETLTPPCSRRVSKPSGKDMMKS